MAKQGIWADKSTFIEFSEPKKGSLSSEIATRDRSIDFVSLGMYLPNPDPVLKKMGKDIKVYTELASDAHVGGCVTSRKAGVKKLLWDVDRGKAKSRQAKFVTDAIKALDIKRIIGEILNAVLFGYQPLEIMWSNGESWVPDDVVGKPQRWFVFDEQNQPRFLTKSDMSLGEELPPRKFLFSRHEATYDNPYGFAELSRCFWPATFKKGGYKFWVKFTEKYGMPWPIGKLPRGLEANEYDNLADILERMVQDGLAVIPDDSSIELLVAEGKGASGSIYKDLIQECKSEISIALLGQNLTTEVKGGSYAAAESHMAVRQDIVDDDKGIVEQTMNTLIEWIAGYNFSERVELPKFILYEEKDVDKAQADRDKTLADTGQLKFTKKYFIKTYGFEEDDIEVVSPAPNPATLPTSTKGAKDNIEFAAPSRPEEDKTPLDTMVSRAVDEAPMDGIWAPVEKLLAESETLEEFRDKLIDLYAGMDVIELGNFMQQAFVAAELAGRFEAMKHNA